MILRNGEEEITLNFNTKNYMVLKKMLKAENLRKALLKAAANGDFDVLATGLKQFSNDKIKSTDAAYELIDSAEDKDELFYEFISQLGENGFFAKATAAALKEEAMQPDRDLGEMIELALPEVLQEAVKDFMKTGANILPTYGANVTNLA